MPRTGRTAGPDDPGKRDWADEPIEAGAVRLTAIASFTIGRLAAESVTRPVRATARKARAL